MKFYNISLNTRLLLAIISGALVFPISFLEHNNPVIFADIGLSDVLIGAVFAILVMVPFQKRQNWLKSLLMVFASIAIYTSMVHLAVDKYSVFKLNINIDWAITISGGIGALLTGIAVQLIASIKLKLASYSMLLLMGLIAGYIFSHTINSSSSIVNSIGFIIWQLLVCLSITIHKR
ncbi:MAG: hypothetical protein AB8B80_12140 [Marinicellaceae bacterium]